MALYVTEHVGVQNLPRPLGPPVAAYSLSSSSTFPFPQAGVSFIRVSADAGMLLCITSTSTAIQPTSTNAFRIAAGVPAELFAVSTTNRVIAIST